MRFLLSTCWLIGAGGGWALALTGLSAGARGAGALADLVLVGGAASWIGMLVTAFRPGKQPNASQWVLAGLSWLMPLSMLAMLGEFDGRLVVLGFATSICVALIVIVYPSQTYQPDIDAARRLQLHLHEVAAREKRRQREEAERAAARGDAEGGEGVEGDSRPAADVGAQGHSSGRPEGPRPEDAEPEDDDDEGDADEGDEDGDGDDESSQNRWQTPTVKRRGRIGSSHRGSSSGDGR